MKKIISFILLSFVVGICGGIFADQILWPYFIERPLFQEYRLEQGPINITERKEVIIQENTALREAVGKVEKSVVGIITESQDKTLKGSGLILTADGLVVTLADLVPQGSAFSFFLEGRPVSFQILKRDLENNLALAKINQGNLSTAGFADLGNLRIGERAFLVGVFQREASIKNMTNEGVVKYFDKDMIYTNMLETSTLSGSSLFNIKGEILGLNTVDYWGRVSAIPVDKIKSFAGF